MEGLSNGKMENLMKNTLAKEMGTGVTQARNLD